VHGGKIQKKIIEVLGELELFIDKKVIFDEFFFSVGRPARRAVCRLPSVSKFCNPHNFFCLST
jgi:hypothetical protein